MPKSTVVKEMEEYLPDISLEELEQMQRRERPGKSSSMLQAAVLRKRCKTIAAIRYCIGFSESTVHGWLARLAAKGLERKHDKKSPGRPSRLNKEQRDAKRGRIAESPQAERHHIRRHQAAHAKRGRIAESPQESGFSRGNWTGKIVARFIGTNSPCHMCTAGALKLAHRLGFTVRTTRSIPYNSATPEG